MLQTVCRRYPEPYPRSDRLNPGDNHRDTETAHNATQLSLQDGSPLKAAHVWVPYVVYVSFTLLQVPLEKFLHRLRVTMNTLHTRGEK